MTLCPQDLFRAGLPAFDPAMHASSRPLPLPEFLRNAKVGPDGNPFLETIRRPIFNAWSVDTLYRHPSQYKLVAYPNMLFEDTRPNGCGPLSLEHLVRRQIVQRHLQEITETVLRGIEWFGRGKKLWEDVLASGEDSWRIFSRFCTIYGHEPDFVPMLERWDAESLPRPSGGSKDIKNRSAIDSTRVIENNDFRYRIQLIKDPLPPWSTSIPLLTAPVPMLNNNDFSWLVCLELTSDSFGGETWTPDDLQYSLGELPNLAVLSVHGTPFLHEPYRIVKDGYLAEWARHARQGKKWGALRILVLEEKVDNLLDSYRPHPRHHLDLRKNPPPPPPPPKRGLFEMLDDFPKLSVVSFHFPPPPAGWGKRTPIEARDGRRFEHAYCIYPLYDFTKSHQLATEGAKQNWFDERIIDYQGTLKDRPKEIKELVKRAGLADMRSLARAGSMLVQVESREKLQTIGAREDWVETGSLDLDITATEGEKGRFRKSTKIPSRQPELPDSRLPPPPIMVNVMFERDPVLIQEIPSFIISKLHRPSHPLQLSGDYEHRRILFEKKRDVAVTTLPSPTLSAPEAGRKRKGSSRLTLTPTTETGTDDSCDEWENIQDWEQELPPGSEGVCGYGRKVSRGTGIPGYKKQRMSVKEAVVKPMEELLAEFMY